jgi:selenocysteine-specific elongation factor
MPQTREHLEIVDLLGVKQGAVALTKIDRVEPARVSGAGGDRGLAPWHGARRPWCLRCRASPAKACRRCARISRPWPRRRWQAWRTAASVSPWTVASTLAGSGTVVTGTVFTGACAW